MDKLSLAHDYILKAMSSQGLHIYVSDIERAFDVAEMMLAEEEKRRDKSLPVVLERLDEINT